MNWYAAPALILLVAIPFFIGVGWFAAAGAAFICVVISLLLAAWAS